MANFTIAAPRVRLGAETRYVLDTDTARANVMTVSRLDAGGLAVGAHVAVAGTLEADQLLGNLAGELVVTDLDVSGNVSALYYTGNGSLLTGLTGVVGGTSSSVTITSVAVTDVDGVALDDTALGESSYLTILGTSFGAGCIAMLGSVAASATTGISQTELRARFTGLAAGTYSLYVINTDGTSAILPSAVTWSLSPVWSGTGTLDATTKTRSFSRTLALANGDSTLTYAISAGSTLPPGTTLLGDGSLSGNITETQSASTSYSFTVKATDLQLQDVPKTFTLNAGFLRVFSGNANVIVSNSTYTGDTNHLAVSNSGGFVKFVSDSPAFLSNVVASLGNVTLSTTLTSSTELRAVVPAAAEGTTRALEITNADGSMLTGANIAQWAPPAWTTASGQLGAAIFKGDSFSQTVAATHGAGNVTYAAISGFPAGVTVDSGGIISGSWPGGATNEIATLVLDAVSTVTLQNATREFTLSLLAQLFVYTTHTFTNADATGRDGPSLAQCRAAYSTTWDETAYFNVTAGIQEWVVPKTNLYRIEVWGAQGGSGAGGSGSGTGSGSGGLGAQMRGDIALTAGEVLKILVGQAGTASTTGSGGAGGGSFVVRQPYNTLASIAIIAGGGGSGGHGDSGTITGVAGTTSQSGTAGVDGLRAGGVDGNGGLGDNAAWGGAGGGGFFGNGGAGKVSGVSYPAGGGWSFTSGGVGGQKLSVLGAPSEHGEMGGFGGGGAGSYGAAGGGGFSGGGADSSTGQTGTDQQGGGGGGSYNNGTNQVNVGGTRSGHGQVTITAL